MSDLKLTVVEKLEKVESFFNHLMVDILKARPDFKAKLEEETADFLGLGPWDLVLQQMMEDAATIETMTDTINKKSREVKLLSRTVAVKTNSANAYQKQAKSLARDLRETREQVRMLEAKLGDPITSDLQISEQEEADTIEYWRGRALKSEKDREGLIRNILKSFEVMTEKYEKKEKR